MLHFLPDVVRGSLSFLLICCNTLIWCVPLYLFALARFLSPESAKPWCTRRAMNIAEFWISCNNLIINLFQKLTIDVEGLDDLHKDRWYLIFSNHQSWTDIFSLQRLFNRRIPLLKFFIKQELIRVPVIGIAWWALDFPIMKRYSRETLKKRPDLIGKDLEATRKSCDKFKLTPVSILNFVEGTRFTPQKHQYQKSPFNHLLKPKGGGAAMVLSSLGAQIDAVINVTIVYREGVPGFFDFLSGKVTRITVHVEKLAVPEKLRTGSYETDRDFRSEFQTWITGLWTRKDQLLDQYLQN
ncbi:MAG: acyltransferase [Pseudomonadales bacterium]|nr:acyltransferase [Pseudomonadales bacterium]